MTQVLLFERRDAPSGASRSRELLDSAFRASLEEYSC